MVSTNGTGIKETPRERYLEKRRRAKWEAFEDRQKIDSVLIEFQPDVVELEKQAVPASARWTLYTVMGLLCATVAWAWWAKVDQIVVAEGKLITSVSPIMVDAKLPSPIRSINVRFGDRVTVGQVLATLDPTVSDADVNILETRQALLEAVYARLSAEKDNLPFDLTGRELDRDWVTQMQLYQDRQAAQNAKLAEFDAEERKLNVTLKNNLDTAEIQKRNYDDYRSYLKKIEALRERESKSELELISARLQTNDAQMKWQESTSRSEELEKELESLQRRREAFVADEKAKVMLELVEVHEKLVELKQELLKATQSQKYTQITVPDSLGYQEFVVFEVADQALGTVMQPGQPLFKLIPLDVPLEVEVEVFGKDIALIRPATRNEIESDNLPAGSEVRIKMASYPFQKHGTLRGAIRTISEDTFEKQDPRGNITMTAYRVRVQLIEPVELENVSSSFRLIPGMATTAEIKVGKRRVIEYFLYPLIRYLDQSIREP